MSQNVNVQLQSHGSPSEAVPLFSDEGEVDELVVLMTGPLSPGLRIRMDTFVLPEADDEVAGEESPITLELDPDDAESLSDMSSVSSAHDQSHLHSHVQSSDDGLPDSMADVVTFPSQSTLYDQLQYHGSSAAGSSY